MKPAIIMLTILVVGGAVVWLIDHLFYPHKTEDTVEGTGQDEPVDAPAQGCADETCGLRTICPSEQILEGACSREITYYDDEELDVFAGRAEDAYSAEEQEQWRDVLYTLQPADLLGWGQSIQHRGLVMPAAIRQEFLQLAAEHRSAAGQ